MACRYTDTKTDRHPHHVVWRFTVVNTVRQFLWEISK